MATSDAGVRTGAGETQSPDPPIERITMAYLKPPPSPASGQSAGKRPSARGVATLTVVGRRTGKLQGAGHSRRDRPGPLLGLPVRRVRLGPQSPSCRHRRAGRKGTARSSTPPRSQSRNGGTSSPGTARSPGASWARASRGCPIPGIIRCSKSARCTDMQSGESPRGGTQFGGTSQVSLCQAAAVS